MCEDINISKYNYYTNKNNRNKIYSSIYLRVLPSVLILCCLIIAIFYFITSMFFINIAKEYITGISYLFKQLNYTISTSDIILSSIIKKSSYNLNNKTTDLNDINDNLIKLIENSNELSNINDIIKQQNSFLYNVDPTNPITSKVNYKIINKIDGNEITYGNISLGFFESTQDV